MLNLATLLEECAHLAGAAGGDRTTTRSAIGRLTKWPIGWRICWLRARRAPGERVALACPRPEFPAIYYGILKSGAVVVPLNILLKSAEFDYYLADSAAVVLFCFEGQQPAAGEEALRAAAKAEQCREVFIIGDRLPLESVSARQ